MDVHLKRGDENMEFWDLLKRCLRPKTHWFCTNSRNLCSFYPTSWGKAITETDGGEIGNKLKRLHFGWRSSWRILYYLNVVSYPDGKGVICHLKIPCSISFSLNALAGNVSCTNALLLLLGLRSRKSDALQHTSFHLLFLFEKKTLHFGWRRVSNFIICEQEWIMPLEAFQEAVSVSILHQLQSLQIRRPHLQNWYFCCTPIEL